MLQLIPGSLLKGARKPERFASGVNGTPATAGGIGYLRAGRRCIMLSISLISRGALLMRSSPLAVIT